MAATLTDASGLFTPNTSASYSPSSLSPVPEAVSRPKNTVLVEVPAFSRAEKDLYHSLPETLLKPGVEFGVSDLEKVVGEYVVDGQSHFFVRFKDGAIHKLPARAFEVCYPELVKEYKLRKKNGELEPFDPYSASIHPVSRMKNKIRIHMGRFVPRKQSEDEADEDTAYTSGTNVPESASYDTSEGNDASNSDFEEDLRPRRSARTKKALPFSPRKTRSSRKYISSGESEDELGSLGTGKTPERSIRRSTRKRGVRLIVLDPRSSQEENQGRGRDRQAPRIPKSVKRKLPRPAYGRIRSIRDLDYDDDPDTAVLRAHREICEKCHQQPTHILLKQPKRGGRRKRQTDDDEEEDEESRIMNKGGWVRCLKCPVAAHWGCLSAEQRDEILKAARDRDREDWRQRQLRDNKADDAEAHVVSDEPKKRPGLDSAEMTDFYCSSCLRGGTCMGCREVAVKVDRDIQKKTPNESVPDLTKPERVVDASQAGELDSDVKMADEQQLTGELESSTLEPVLEELPEELLFRCITCKRLAHYSHLPVPTSRQAEATPMNSIDLARYYQLDTIWDCADCFSFTYKVHRILAWRPYPPDAKEPSVGQDETPDMRRQLPREYLIKWMDRSYRRTQWVPHMWLASRNWLILRFFLMNGPAVELLPEPLPESEIASAAGMSSAHDSFVPPNFEIDSKDSRASSVKPNDTSQRLFSDPSPNAERRIPLAWKTVDRILDVLFWSPGNRRGTSHRKPKRSSPTADQSVVDPLVQAEYTAAFKDGEQPSEDLTETIAEYEARVGRNITMEDVDQVIWAFIKWSDLPYDESTWDAPPRPEEHGHPAFVAGFETFVASRSLVVPKRTGASLALVGNRRLGGYRKFVVADGEQPELGQAANLKLMPFQIDGLNWLCNNWWELQHCILADEMGLGKTVQIAAFLGRIMRMWDTFPALVVVPNSTITNWVREFSRWAPGLCVVPFHGGAKGRALVKKYELYHERVEKGTTGLKFHVLITTYDTITNTKDSAPVFKNVPRWEVLVVDEGQRIKNDNSLLFRKLKELNCIHRILMTGTPLNNNIRELFNLMNFLDPKEWNDLTALEEEYKELTEDLLKQLHVRLRPYFLRRIKSEVLQLPPKNEVIVPVSMTPLQKNVYRSILSKNFEILKSLTEQARSKVKGAMSSRFVLMELRKCLQHPYLCDRAIEPDNLPPQEAHEKLIDASAKLRLLKALLPKLKARGHRVLLFSQFVIALDIIEDFITGEGFSFLRLDGDTPQLERQKGMDNFNRPGSDIFIYLLSTRAGGVGINLWSADTVILHDPDFNPHQDLQAISRSHRYGQEKTCLVFKLMVKDSAEERIIHAGKKKLVLDHLIVQKMDDDNESESLQSILTYGAKALFEGTDAKDIIYSDHDLDSLIEKTEQAETKEEAPKEGTFSFSFAKIWAADKDTLEEVPDAVIREDQDSWAYTLQRIETELRKEKVTEATGRGVRRKAAAAFHQQLDNGKYKKAKRAQSKLSSEESEAYILSEGHDSSADGSEFNGPTAITPISTSSEPSFLDPESSSLGPEPSFLKLTIKPPRPDPSDMASSKGKNKVQEWPVRDIPSSAIDGSNTDLDDCGLCGELHESGHCRMTDNTENLLTYRSMLLQSSYEAPEERRAAVFAIDKTLKKRGQTHRLGDHPLLVVGSSSAYMGGKHGTHQYPRPNRGSGSGSKSMHVTKPKIKSTSTVGQGTQPTGSHTVRSAQKPIARTSGGSSQPAAVGSEISDKWKLCQLECGQPAHESLEQCPVVTAGINSITQAIQKHYYNPKMFHIVSQLQKIRTSLRDHSQRNSIVLSESD